MIKKFIASVALLLVFSFSSFAGVEQYGILKKVYSNPGVAESFKVGGDWYPYPAYTDRVGWDKMMTKSMKKTFIKNAEKYLNYKWQHIPASTFLAINTTGDKQAMRKIEEKNRQAFVALMMGELAEGEGRFLSQLADGFWFYSTSFHWSHSNQTHGNLPRYENERLALGNVRLAATIPVCYHFFKDEFDKIDKSLNEVFKATLHRIILDPWLEASVDNGNWWIGGVKPVNNWNPWCNHGVILAFLLVEEDQQRLDAAIKKSVESVDWYLHDYPEDAACLEGAGYWGQSVSRFCEYLQMMRDASGGKFEVLPNEYIQRMGEYKSRVFVGHNKDGKCLQVNFADGNATGGLSPIMMWKTGKMYGSQELMDMALYLTSDPVKKKFNSPKFTADEGYRQLENVRVFRQFNHKVTLLGELLKDGKEFTEVVDDLRSKVPHYTWYPVTQQAFLRTSDNWFVGAKAGHNGEVHGHNDVGSFILYADNVPFFVDPGVGTYVADTFGKNRYTIWSMQSGWHNCPVVNGVEQHNGAQYKASSCVFSTVKNGYRLVSEFAAAYPEDAACKSYVRTLDLVDRTGASSLTVTDTWSLAKRVAADELHFITPGRVLVKNPREVVVEYQGQSLRVSCSDNLSVSVNEKIIDDDRIGHHWGGSLRQIVFKSADNAPLSGTYTVRVTK